MDAASKILQGVSVHGSDHVIRSVSRKTGYLVETKLHLRVDRSISAWRYDRKVWGVTIV